MLKRLYLFSLDFVFHMPLVKEFKRRKVQRPCRPVPRHLLVIRWLRSFADKYCLVVLGICAGGLSFRKSVILVVETFEFAHSSVVFACRLECPQFPEEEIRAMIFVLCIVHQTVNLSLRIGLHATCMGSKCRICVHHTC